ncbi:fungal specific transcription factor domain-containing protein [Colletotrichum karsti]|uniref:Fungal specific transcription factor domain-containing protein n=1 Tax=Colletotrichum karsti TaxID=1095194 RepID=A0A9P6LFW3_9PEZI|nr:fungal specific transcription factor domain-containing protein [Colletotrichum karsti]KAF9871005.1 fungal specific transcription factor domain-containing protein [Colletotrichum karsti]
MTDSMSSSSEQPPISSDQSHPKRIRLSLACNQCRKRKVRCDAQTPKCHNCILRGDDCQTTNPRNPKENAVRRWASKSNTTRSDASIHESSEPPRDRHIRTASPRPRQYLSPAYDDGSEGEDAASRRLSWVAQAYRANARDNDSGHAHHDHSDLNPDMALNTDETPHRFKFMGGSSVQSLTMFADLFFRKRGLRTLSPYFRFGMHHVEEFQVPLTLQLPSLPPLSSLDAYLDVYMKRIFPLFPVFDEPTIRSDMDRLVSLQEANASGGLQSAIEPSQIPTLVSIYSIICISADEETGIVTEVGTHFLTVAYSLLAHVISTPYLASVQALVLLAIALRGRSKEGQGWQTLGQAIRIAHSVGLHRHASTRHPRNPPAVANSAPSPGYQGSRKLHSQLWWTCYTLEKLMELETGRPSAIHDSDCDQTLPEPVPVPAAGIAMSIGSSPEGQAERQTIDYFQPWASLTRIISSISAHIYRRSGQAQTPRLLLGDTVRLDSALTEWAQSLPPEIRPPGPNSGNVILCETGHKHLAIFLAIHYHHALISLHRAALVFPEAMYRTHINTQADSAGLSSVELSRLRRGSEICIGSARAIIRLIGEIADDSTPTPRARNGMLGEPHTNRSESIIFTITHPLISAVALALHILKQPSSRLARSDLELLGIAAQYAEEQYTKVTQNPRFIQACSVLQSNMAEIVSSQHTQGHGNYSHHHQHRDSIASDNMSWRGNEKTSTETPTMGNVGAEMDVMDLELPDLTGMFTEISNTDIFGGVRLEDLWGMLGTAADGQAAEGSEGSWSRS